MAEAIKYGWFDVENENEFQSVYNNNVVAQ